MNTIYKYPIPPQNYLAEEILLGIILIYPKIFTNIINLIHQEHFFLESHQVIYLHLITIYNKNQLYSTNLFYELSNNNILDEIGGTRKILEIMKQGQLFIPSNEITTYTQEIINLINNYYIKRLMIQYGQNIIKLAYIQNISPYKIYNKASHYLNITERKIPKKILNTFDELISNFLLQLTYNNHNQFQYLQKSQYNILTSGFINLDKIITGFTNGDLIVIAGRPSMGKTSLAINIAYNMINNQNIGICIFSLEMSSEQILYKFLSIASKIAINYINLQKISIQQWNSIKSTCYKFINKSIFINDQINVSIDYIEYTSKLLKKEYDKIQLIIIDYLQLIQIDNIYNFNRSQELSFITRKLKLLAQYINIPIIILSQLNRSIEQRNNKKPILSDLKESGCIDYQQNIETLHKKELNIHSYIHDNYLNKIFNKKNFYISILTNYVFHTKIKDHTKYFLQTTYNHKYLDIKRWLPINHIIDHYYMNYHIKTIFYNTYINKIDFIYYNIVYDIYIPSNFHFIGNQFILHNSIEQDADIVIMIYEENPLEEYKEEEKILDISICKNRNGPTGTCKLTFFKKTTSFQDFNMTQIIYNFDSI